jgi:glycosyltransferase involved in cell wall biosynthesis
MNKFYITPRVSIIMLTYNHKDYIRDAIYGCVSQITSFPYELIICDDCSIDGSIDTIKEFKSAYPDKIMLSMQKKKYAKF